MNSYLFIFIIFTIIYLYILSTTDNSAKFKKIEMLTENAGGYCTECNERTFGQCLKCYNCGYCKNGKTGKCMRGNIFGPDTKTKCDTWLTNDNYQRNNEINHK